MGGDEIQLSFSELNRVHLLIVTHFLSNFPAFEVTGTEMIGTQQYQSRNFLSEAEKLK
jgi:hypothetical protein